VLGLEARIVLVVNKYYLSSDSHIPRLLLANEGLKLLLALLPFF